MQARIDALQTQEDGLNAELGVSWNNKKAKAGEDIGQKYCALEYFRSIKRFRIYASMKGLRRPWDGQDGKDFIFWLRKFGSKYKPGTLDITDLDSMMAEDEAKLAKEKEEEENEAFAAGRKIAVSAVSWRGYFSRWLDYFFTLIGSL